MKRWIFAGVIGMTILVTLIFQGGSNAKGTDCWATPIAVDDPPVWTDGNEEIPVYALPNTGSGWVAGAQSTALWALRGRH